jgi:hypothetical protein
MWRGFYHRAIGDSTEAQFPSFARLLVLAARFKFGVGARGLKEGTNGDYSQGREVNRLAFAFLTLQCKY